VSSVAERRTSAWPPRAVLVIALLALAGKLWLAATTYGTNDVAAWMRFALAIRSGGAAHLYARDPDFNHPPFMVHVLEALAWLSDRHWLTFEFWLRLPAILADFGSLVLAYRIYARRADGPADRVSLGLLAAAPISLFVSGFHGNTDPVMMFFLLLAVNHIDAPERTWLAGAAFGMAINIKAVALMFAAVAFLHLPNARRRLVFFGAAAIAVAIASMPILIDAPGLLALRVLGYGSHFGHWGLSRLAAMTPAELGLAYALRGWGTACLLAVIVALSFWLNRGRAKPSLYRQVGVIVFAFLTLSPGFGVQYLAWLVPWTLGVRKWAVFLFHAVCAVFLFAVYTYWSRGFPWSFADSDAVGDWGASIVPLELAAWASVVIVFVALLRAARAERRGGSAAGASSVL
jgi:hypothetical protein